MTEFGGRPRGGAVAGVTRGRSGSMSRIFTLGARSVMAGIAGAGRDAAVAESSRRPRVGAVAGVATRGCWNMVYSLDGCAHPVA